MQGGFQIVILILISHNAFSKEILKASRTTDVYYRPDKHEDVKNHNFMIIEYKEERSIADVWNNIKNSAKNAWNALKILVNNTKDKIKTWIQNVKDRAVNIGQSFKERLEALKSKLINIIQEIAENEKVKKCFQEEDEKINNILRDVVEHVSTCIANKLTGLAALEDYKILDTLVDDTKFTEKIDARLDACKQNRESVEDCFQNVREDILKEIEEVEDEVLRSRSISRDFADDILEAIITCSTDGLIEVSAALTNEIVQIIKCITRVNLTQHY